MQSRPDTRAAKRPMPRGAYNTKKTAAVVGAVAGGAAFGITLLAAPAVIQAATYFLADWMATWASASVATYVGAMVAIGLLTAIAGAMLALAVRWAVNAVMDRSRAPAKARGETLTGDGTEMGTMGGNAPTATAAARQSGGATPPQRQHQGTRVSQRPAATAATAATSAHSMFQTPAQGTGPASGFDSDRDSEFSAAPAPAGAFQ